MAQYVKLRTFLVFRLKSVQITKNTYFKPDLHTTNRVIYVLLTTKSN